MSTQHHKVYDLRSSIGCSDNPIAEIIKKMQSNEEFIAIIEKRVLPFQLARLLCSRYGYDVDVLEEENDAYKLRFTRRTDKHLE